MGIKSPNILLVILDSVRAKNTTIHGYHRNTTPFLREFAEKHTSYRQARAPGMTSLPSHTSIFTGLEVKEHGIHDLLTHQLDPTETIWHSLSSEHGYTTGVFSDNVNLTGEGSLKECFDYVVGRRGRLFHQAADPDVFFNSPEYLQSKSDRSKYVEYLIHCMGSDHPVKGFANGVAKQLSLSLSSALLEQRLDHSANRFLNPFYSWIDGLEGPWGACINLMDTHFPFYPMKEHNQWDKKKLKQKQAALNPTSWKVYGEHVSVEQWASLKDLYDGSIKQADYYIESLVQQLKDRGEFSNTLLVITSDHGEGFGEYSRVRPEIPIIGHIVGLREELLHVPLIVSYPGQSNGREVSQPATLRQFPKVVETVIMDEWQGDEFVPDGPVVSSASTVDLKMKSAQRAGKYCDDVTPYHGPIRAVYTSEDKSIYKYLIWDDDAVTVKIDDAQSASIINRGKPRREVETVFKSLSDADVVSEQNEVDDQTLSHLESLGYV